MTQVPVTDARSEKMKQTIAIIRFNSVQPSIANSFHIILESTLQNLKEGAVLKKTLFLEPSAAYFHIRCLTRVELLNFLCS